jgi:hypothetical protein
MVSSSQPFLNVEDSNLNAKTLIFVGYDNNMSVEMLQEENKTLYTPENVIIGSVDEDDVEDDPSVDAYISKLHLANLEKQQVAWKPYTLNLKPYF